MQNIGKDWEELKHKNCIDAKIQVFYKIGENGKVATILQMDIPYDIIHLSSLFFEFDLFPVWMEQTPEAFKVMLPLKGPTDLTVGIAFQVPLKWPMWDRWMVMQSVTFMDPATGGIFNVSNSIPSEAKNWF